jgi:hypothetical protein
MPENQWQIISFTFDGVLSWCCQLVLTHSIKRYLYEYLHKMTCVMTIVKAMYFCDKWSKRKQIAYVIYRSHTENQVNSEILS